MANDNERRARMNGLYNKPLAQEIRATDNDRDGLTDRDRFDLAVAEERRRQIELGYDAAHDDAHDILHLFDVARHKAYQGHGVEVAAMLEAIYEKLARGGHRRTRVVETVEELEALPVGAVVLSAGGTIACRFDDYRGTVFGDDRPFGPWTRLALPATVLFTPDGSES